MSDEGKDRSKPAGSPDDPTATEERRKPMPYRALGPNTSASWSASSDDLGHAEAIEETLDVEGAADELAKSSTGGAEAVVGRWSSPVGRLARTILALVVFFAVPVFGIAEQGFVGYLKGYLEPTPLMLPFNIIGELSRTLALAVRLFGNIMSGSLVVAVLLAIVPLFAPIVMEALGLLIGQVQAYIFAVLATVYIGAATRDDHDTQKAQTATSPEVT